MIIYTKLTNAMIFITMYISKWVSVSHDHTYSLSVHRSASLLHCGCPWDFSSCILFSLAEMEAPRMSNVEDISQFHSSTVYQNKKWRQAPRKHFTWIILLPLWKHTRYPWPWPLTYIHLNIMASILYYLTFHGNFMENGQ